jgi:YgiT-type zinc finger domain-containing protein
MSESSRYGQCPCRGTYESRRVNVEMTVDGRRITLTNVRQGACPVCGARVYKLSVLQFLESTLKSGG